MAELLTEPASEEASRRKSADKAALALCLLLALAAFTVKPTWRALDDRMRVRYALEADGPRWPTIKLDTVTGELDQRSEEGVDPWGRPWARLLGYSAIAGSSVEGARPSIWLIDHEFEPDVSIYSAGPDGVIERGGGDDVLPYARGDWRAVTCEQARKLLLVLCALLSLTHAIASRLPRAEPLPVEGLLVATLALVPALVCTVGVSVYYGELLVALRPILLWQSKLGLLVTLLGSMLLVWSIFLAAVRLRLAPRTAPEKA